jgi:multiple sugar transport system permease protein
MGLMAETSEGGRNGKAAIVALMLLLLVIFIGPIVWFVLLAIRPADTFFTMPPVLVFQPSWDSVNYAFGNPGNNLPQLFNSLVVAAGAVLVSLPAAYALSRFRVRGRKHLMMWYLGLLMAPPVAFLIPYSVLASAAGLKGSYFSMILILQTLTIPFSIWLLRSFIDEVPVEIEEAARVDGASTATIILRIVLPLILPGVIVTSMFAFVFSWNNAAFPLVLSNRETATLPVGTLRYFGTAGVTWGFIAAAAVAAMIPPMLIFLALDRYVVRGLTFGSVKG